MMWSLPLSKWFFKMMMMKLYCHFWRIVCYDALGPPTRTSLRTSSSPSAVAQLYIWYIPVFRSQYLQIQSIDRSCATGEEQIKWWKPWPAPLVSLCRYLHLASRQSLLVIAGVMYNSESTSENFKRHFSLWAAYTSLSGRLSSAFTSSIINSAPDIRNTSLFRTRRGRHRTPFKKDAFSFSNCSICSNVMYCQYNCKAYVAMGNIFIRNNLSAVSTESSLSRGRHENAKRALRIRTKEHGRLHNYSDSLKSGIVCEVHYPARRSYTLRNGIYREI
jgi:hypothetical protein